MAAEMDVVEAVFDMTRGATMLKAGRKGRPHYRRFMLSRDLSSLQWQSPRKDTDKSVVHISQITELKRGQKTKVFETCILPHVESLSFSVEYKVAQGDLRTLDIVCCDKSQYETWTKGAEALIAGFADKGAVDALYANKDQTDQPSTFKLEFSTLGKTILQYQEDACEMYTWGEGAKGVLGHGEDIEENQPRILEALVGRDIKHLACGATHTIAVAKSGEVFSWGSGYSGKLGQGHLRDRFSPLRIASLKEKQILRVACHEMHSAAVSVDGELYTWGKTGPWLGYLGSSGKQLTPRLVEGLGDQDNKVSDVSCGMKHTLVCTVSGKVFAFGDNEYGQLGISNTEKSDFPLHLGSLVSQPIVRVSCGQFHSAVISKSGGLWLWGHNEFGQLGAGTYESISEPFHINSTPDFRNAFVSYVSCGARHSAFVANGKTKKIELYCMGSNSHSQLGVRSNLAGEKQYSAYNCPVQIHFNSDSAPLQVACGDAHTALVTASGEIFTWGRGKGGRLGHNDSRDRPLPCEIDSMEGKQVRAVACGGSHTACTITRAWVLDDEIKNCMACRLKFALNRKRHHCRQCGGVFCNPCSSKKTPIVARGYSNLVRVCDKCYAVLSQNM